MLAFTMFYMCKRINYTYKFWPVLRLSRHINLRPCGNSILTLPEARDSLLLRIEVQARLAVESVRTTARHRLLITREAEHGQWDRDGNVDADLTGLDLFLELAGGGARRGEDGGAVTVLVLVDELDCFVQAVDVQADEDRAEDLFAVATHVFCHVGDDSWADLCCRLSAERTS